MSQFGILQECTVTHRKHWVQPSDHGIAFTAAAGGPSGVGHPRSLGYDDRISAERGVELAKADNERQVAATKRSRKFKTHPATYTIVELN